MALAFADGVVILLLFYKHLTFQLTVQSSASGNTLRLVVSCIPTQVSQTNGSKYIHEILPFNYRKYPTLSSPNHHKISTGFMTLRSKYTHPPNGFYIFGIMVDEPLTEKVPHNEQPAYKILDIYGHIYYMQET